MAGSREEGLDHAIVALESLLEQYRSVAPGQLSDKEWLALRAKSGVHLAEFSVACNEVAHSFGLSSARRRLLEYFRVRVGETVTKEELSGVAGIEEWARRVRELRVEHGWRIESGLTRSDRKPSEYELVSLEPDVELASRWRIAKRIRNLKNPNGRASSIRDRLLAYLTEISPAAADQEQLGYVAKRQSWPRRMRELTEDGWQIESSIDNAELAPGAYRLKSLERLPPRSRQAIKLRHRILERDGYSCQDCGASPRSGPVQLQVHHVKFVQHGGTNAPSNLRTLCSNCHAGVHAVEHGLTEDELLVPNAEQTYRSN